MVISAWLFLFFLHFLSMIKKKTPLPWFFVELLELLLETEKQDSSFLCRTASL